MTTLVASAPVVLVTVSVYWIWSPGRTVNAVFEHPGLAGERSHAVFASVRSAAAAICGCSAGSASPSDSTTAAMRTPNEVALDTSFLLVDDSRPCANAGSRHIPCEHSLLHRTSRTGWMVCQAHACTQDTPVHSIGTILRF